MVGYRSSDPDSVAHVTNTRLGKVAAENITVTINGRSGQGIAHADEIIGDDQVPCRAVFWVLIGPHVP